MSDVIEALQKLGQDLGEKIDGLASSSRQEEILNSVNEINGYVRDHGEILAGHQQWMESHDKVHEGQDKDFRSLSSRVWILSGGSGLLAAVAMILQTLNL